MTFISLECEKLTKEYTSSDNPFGFKKDKRIEKWINDNNEDFIDN